jgi:hypothetical protein
MVGVRRGRRCVVGCRESGRQYFFTLAVDQAGSGFEVFDSCEEVVQMSESKCTLGLFKECQYLR